MKNCERKKKGGDQQENHTRTDVLKVPVSTTDITSSLPVFEVNRTGFLPQGTH